MAEPTDTGALACSLTDEEFRERRTMARASLLDHLVKIEKIELGLRLYFIDTDAVRSTVETFVQLERQCCDFLTLTVTPPDEGLTVTIEGPPEAKETLVILSEALRKAR